MSQFNELRANAFADSTKPSQPKERWIRQADPIEALWTDRDGKPHLAKGRFKGIRVPASDDGGPVQFIVEGSDGEVDVNAEDLVGITPVS